MVVADSQQVEREPEEEKKPEPKAKTETYPAVIELFSSDEDAVVPEPKAKKEEYPDVIELFSSDEDAVVPEPKAKQEKAPDVIKLSRSDKDMVCVNEAAQEEEEDDDDPNNSRQHINDAMNQPDLYGNVLVNVAHPPDELDIFLAPQIARAVKPHQVHVAYREPYGLIYGVWTFYYRPPIKSVISHHQTSCSPLCMLNFDSSTS